MSDEEGAKPFMTENQRDTLTSLDLFYLTINLSKFCAKNCGVFKKQSESNEYPNDCLSISIINFFSKSLRIFLFYES